MTAIGPGSTIWRAIRQPNVLPRRAMAEFSDRNEDDQSEYLIYMHARLLWLEARGLITYHWHVSEQVRQKLEANSEVIRRLTDDRPAP